MPDRWRGDAGSSPLDLARAATSSPRNDFVKNCRVHPTHWLISTQVAGVARAVAVADAAAPGPDAARLRAVAADEKPTKNARPEPQGRPARLECCARPRAVGLQARGLHRFWLRLFAALPARYNPGRGRVPVRRAPRPQGRSVYAERRRRTPRLPFRRVRGRRRTRRAPGLRRGVTDRLQLILSRYIMTFISISMLFGFVALLLRCWN